MRDKLRPYKKPIILVVILLLIYLILGKLLPSLSNAQAAKSPIVGIEATNKHEYRQDQKIKASDFDVKAIHENGKKTDLDEFELSTTTPERVGKTTSVTISLKKNKEIKCTIKVKNERKKLVSYECGNPNISDVEAVIYSNGEMCFEGEGDILIFDDFPWADEDDDAPVKSISFEKTVTPKSLDGFFKGMEGIEYIHNIPVSVESMEETFSKTSITVAPDVSACTKLVNMKGTYKECELLEEVPKLPASVKTTVSMCEECPELRVSSDASEAASLLNMDSMYADCQKITSVSLAPNVKTINETCKNCINLKKMPEIPESTLEMNGTFAGAVSLTDMTTIPANVYDVSSCFQDCKNLKGILNISANPINYSSFLKGIATATPVDLQGSSIILDVLANTADHNINVTVNGNAPNFDIRRNDIIEDEEEQDIFTY